jgi:2-oxoglutarate ferredoxin oxidoreductase subunit delta
VIHHFIDSKRCDGCGQCVEICNLNLWEVVEEEGGRASARTVDGAARTCHFCFFCKDICPHNAVTILSEEDDVLGRI